MKISLKLKIFLFSFSLGFCFWSGNTLAQVEDESVFCFCKTEASGEKSICQETFSSNCAEDYFVNLSKEGYTCEVVGSYANCDAMRKEYDRENNPVVKSIVGAVLPSCVVEDNLSAECRDVSIFVELAINIGKYIFSFIGALVLLMFIIGGFQLIISQGNPEKVKQATNILLGATIGLAIVFGAYILVDFLGNTVGLSETYKLSQ